MDFSRFWICYRKLITSSIGIKIIVWGLNSRWQTFSWSYNRTNIWVHVYTTMRHGTLCGYLMYTKWDHMHTYTWTHHVAMTMTDNTHHTGITCMPNGGSHVHHMDTLYGNNDDKLHIIWVSHECQIGGHMHTAWIHHTAMTITTFIHFYPRANKN